MADIEWPSIIIPKGLTDAQINNLIAADPTRTGYGSILSWAVGQPGYMVSHDVISPLFEQLPPLSVFKGLPHGIQISLPDMTVYTGTTTEPGQTLSSFLDSFLNQGNVVAQLPNTPNPQDATAFQGASASSGAYVDFTSLSLVPDWIKQILNQIGKWVAIVTQPFVDAEKDVKDISTRVVNAGKDAQAITTFIGAPQTLERIGAIILGMLLFWIGFNVFVGGFVMRGIESGVKVATKASTT